MLASWAAGISTCLYEAALDALATLSCPLASPSSSCKAPIVLCLYWANKMLYILLEQKIMLICLLVTISCTCVVAALWQVLKPVGGHTHLLITSCGELQQLALYTPCPLCQFAS